MRFLGELAAMTAIFVVIVVLVPWLSFGLGLLHVYWPSWLSIPRYFAWCRRKQDDIKNKKNPFETDSKHY